MKLYLFNTPTSLDTRHINYLLNRVCEETDTHDLVTAVYFLPGKNLVRGVAMTRHWIGRNGFCTSRGAWNFTNRFGAPDDLPEQFKLIRIRMDNQPRHYPRWEQDIYGWRFLYHSLDEHLMRLFAHELHHFRRFHLNLHPREGEQKANQWSLDRLRGMGIDLQNERIIRKKSKPSLIKRWARQFPQMDPYSPFRSLTAGALLKIVHDPKNRYAGRQVKVVRGPRKHSKRVVIRTPDGKEWRWPMAWLEIVPESHCPGDG